MTRHSGFLLLVLAVASGLMSVSAQEVPDEVPRFVETVEIKVINVDAHVTDRKGRPVTGLTIDDFEVYENGALQELTNFYEVRERRVVTSDRPRAEPDDAKKSEPREDPVPPVNLQRKVVLFIDNVSLAPYNRNRVITAMKQMVGDLLEPGDEAMVVTWNRSLNIRLPFTSETRQINDMLDIIGGETAGGRQRERNIRLVQTRIREAPSYDEALAIARDEVASLEHDVRTAIQVVRGLIAMVGGIEGKKALVITTEGLEMQPGLDLYYFIREIAPERWEASAGSLLEGYSDAVSGTIDSLAHDANAQGITLYTIHAGGLGGGVAPGSAMEGEMGSIVVNSVAFNNSVQTLQHLANMTGGLTIAGTSDYRPALRKIEQDLSSYYSLGYRSATERIDRRRSITVRMKNKEYRVRHRSSFVEKSIDTEMTDRVTANLFHSSSRNDLGIVVTSGVPVAADSERYRVPVEIHIPVRELTLLTSDGEKHLGGFSLWVLAGDSRYNQSDLTKRDHSFMLTAEQLAEIRNGYYIYDVELVLRAGRNTVSVGVIDQFSREQGLATLEVLARDLR